MGLEIDRDQFRGRDYDRFADRLASCLGALEELLAQPAFGRGRPELGAELELALIDDAGRALPMNEEVILETVDERMTVELDRFNLECNLLHCGLAGRPFSHLRRELESARAELRRAAAIHGGRIAMTGILPTLTEADLQTSAMTDELRYRALSRSLRGRRSGPFRLDIDGGDPLRLDCHDVTYEGAATSLQVHLRVEPGRFRDVFDAAQLATAPALAAAANSPTFLGHRLWSETRVALFKQAVDDRDPEFRAGPARVSFGTGWLKEGPLELFQQAVREYPVLLPVLDAEDPNAVLDAGEIPALREIRLHQGTVWSWNRPVYHPRGGGHVRIELRALPSGPTVSDMVANVAFLVGLTLGLTPHMPRIREILPFEVAHSNFYRAAQSGLDGLLFWPDPETGTCETRSAGALVTRLTTLAREGLRDYEIDDAEAEDTIATIEQRAERRQTGATWQRARLASFERGRPSSDGLTRMLEEYVARSESGAPVHEWGLD